MTHCPPLRAAIRVEFDHRVYFTRQAFAPANGLLRDVLQTATGPPARALVILDEALTVARPDLPEAIRGYFARHPGGLALTGAPLAFPAGETIKNGRGALDEIHAAIARQGLCRHSYVVAIGGGALLDVAGFAAATAHRGLRLVRLPTTTLAQADAGVGVKNGLNAFGQKNFIGAFAVPHAVINDFDFLNTLAPGEKRAGYAEAVKVALIRDAAFFGQLERDADALAAFEPAAMERLIRRSAELHVAHIAQGGDPFEFGSARPLDFGHWAAHKLERLSHFRLGHGAAVAIGLMLDVLYSRRLGWLDAASAGRVGALLRRLGFDLFCPELASLDELLTGLEEFRAHLGGPLTVTMLKGIGEGFEVHEVMAEQVRAAAEELPGLSRRACP